MNESDIETVSKTIEALVLLRIRLGLGQAPDPPLFEAIETRMKDFCGLYQGLKNGKGTHDATNTNT